MKWIIPNDGVLGAVSMDWKNKKVDWFGMDGCGDAEPHEVLEFCKEAEEKGHYTGYLIFWKDQDQLSVHDESGFLEEVYEEEE